MPDVSKIEINAEGTRVTVRFFGRVTEGDMRAHLAEIEALQARVSPGFVVLADLTGLASMDPACTDILRLVMDRMNSYGAGRVVRVIPDPKKDIGFNILSLFHYKPGTPINTCETWEEAMALIG